MTNNIAQQALDCLSYGLYLVTSHLNNKPNGQISNALIQVTAEPPEVALCIHREELTYEYIIKSGVFAVSILDKETPMDLIRLFGYKTGRNLDKFSNMKFREGITGCPLVIDNAVAVFEAKVTRTIDICTHSIFVGNVVNAEVLKNADPLTYKFFKEVKKGRASKNAPTYRTY